MPIVTLPEEEAVGGEEEAHASEHQDGGADEINVGNLSGELADNQPPLTLGVVLSGQVTLSSGVATIDTTLSATDATFMLALGIDDPNADCELAGRVFWDDSAGTYKIKILEQNTSVGNPTVNYDVIRVR